MELSLQERCGIVREDVVNMIHTAGSGHPGSSLSVVEILVSLYFGGAFHCRPKQPEWEGRDRLVLSKGHGVPALYSILSQMGFFSTDLLYTLRKLGSPLQGHPKRGTVPGLDYSAGSLGQGLSVATGMALAMGRKGLPGRVFCILGDGELQEGQVWEAAMTAAHHRLASLCVIVDNNRVQLDGYTADIKRIDPIGGKFAAFGFHALEADGHDTDGLLKAFAGAAQWGDGPSVVVANTVKGKGVSYMENAAAWHSAVVGSAALHTALADIRGNPI